MSLFDLAGRTAIVIGGTSGIGRALAVGLAAVSYTHLTLPTTERV